MSEIASIIGIMVIIGTAVRPLYYQKHKASNVVCNTGQDSTGQRTGQDRARTREAACNLTQIASVLIDALSESVRFEQ